MSMDVPSREAPLERILGELPSFYVMSHFHMAKSGNALPFPFPIMPNPRWLSTLSAV